ncbi:conserved exported hypothetical protein [Carnobacterium maltaromaticum]|uniref:hypothetical protein n=1 Tax=Carnobacterium maltaromaticum TaxID=2751 RepID=UPI00191BA275|nr:hypothetical protein [Carnobacterium maltaromaticum]CAD5896739.1 conserved exported hypothetical protein [Carnobacterium maltaromaticum]
MKMKIVRGLFLMALISSFLLLSIEKGHAETKEYESNSGVGFYGEYVFPENVKPPNLLPDSEGSVPVGKTPIMQESGKFLPQTGMARMNGAVTGIIFLVAALALTTKKFKQPKGEKNNENL